MRRLCVIVLFLCWAPAAASATPLVTADWLVENAGRPDLVILDLRSRLNGGSRAAFEEDHIAGAVYSDYLRAGWRVTRDGVPGQLPSVADLEVLIGGLGIGNESHVVLVAGGLSALGMASATRVYWTFKVLGHDRVSILDGGYRAYLADPARPLESGWKRRPAATFKANFRPDLLAGRDDVAGALLSGGALVDNRPSPFYRGEVKSPAVARAGTLPGAVNVPEARLVGGDGYFVSADRASGLMRLASLTAEVGPISFCNTGHWASLGWFVESEILGNKSAKLYDGSMADWAADPARPVEIP